MSPRVVVFGGSGFIGSQILVSLRRAGHNTLGACRHPGPGSGLVSADLRDPSSLLKLSRNADFAFLSAPYLGTDQRTEWEINVRGAQNFVDTAKRAGIEGIFYISTTSVYGSGPFVQSKVGDKEASPASWRSKQRLLAERIILNAGGLVLRTNLVFGPTEQWFTRPLTQLIGGIGGIPPSMTTARLSYIDSRILGKACANLVEKKIVLRGANVLHAVMPIPVRTADIIREGFAHQNRVPPDNHVSDSVARSYALHLGFSTHQVDMFMMDNLFDPGAFIQLITL